jgi:ferric-dicitrate binding protein FerR (iron transport regulator)
VTPHEDSHPSLSPEEERAVQAVRSLGDVPVDPDFRARLRREFVAGAIAPGRAGETAHGPRAGRRPAAVVPLFGLAAAAAVAILIWLASEAPRWEYVGASGASGELWVSGQRMDPEDADGIEAMLEPGAHIRTTGEMQVDIVLRNRLSVQVAPEAEVTVPDRPRRWFGGSAACEVMQGEIRFVTGPEMPGSRILVRAPLTSVEVTGTSFAVISGPDSVCVCVLDGTVHMTDADGSAYAVPGGKRRTVFRSKPAHLEDILPMERMKLQMLPSPVPEE